MRRSSFGTEGDLRPYCFDHSIGIANAITFLHVALALAQSLNAADGYSRIDSLFRSRTSSADLIAKLAYEYSAFEAPSEAPCGHSYYFQSIAHGDFPKRVLNVDGCVKSATDDVNLARFVVARRERYFDADL